MLVDCLQRDFLHVVRNMHQHRTWGVQPDADAASKVYSDQGRSSAAEIQYLERSLVCFFAFALTAPSTFNAEETPHFSPSPKVYNGKYWVCAKRRYPHSYTIAVEFLPTTPGLYARVYF